MLGYDPLENVVCSEEEMLKELYFPSAPCRSHTWQDAITVTMKEHEQATYRAVSREDLFKEKIKLIFLQKES